jgi:uncharacterized repeat protein (TIGR01451 family)
MHMTQAFVLRSIAIATFLTAAVPALRSQTTSIQLFSPVNVRHSASGTGYGASKVAFNSATLSLSCAASPIQATLSSTPDSTGNVLVDNYINLTVTLSSGTPSAPVNVCHGGYVESTPDGVTQNCFNSAYRAAAVTGSLTGQPPNPATEGVPAIDISGHLLAATAQTLKLDFIDSGAYYLTNSAVYLNTNCTQIGVTGPAKITGNPMSATNPTGAQLAQDFTFDPSPDQRINFGYDLTAAQNAGQLTIANGAIPNTADLPIDPATFRSIYLPGTSFATSTCLVHTGELLPDGTPACKLYTLSCQVGTGASSTGAQCPISQLRNEVFQDEFDGPAFTLPDIAIPNGPTFHQGVGFLMAKEGWLGGLCTFDPAANLGNLLCPQNLLTNFSGPGFYVGTGLGTHPNSAFISIAPVPEDLTTVTVAGQHPGGWINSQSAAVTFSSQPPILAGLQPALPGQNNFVPAAIASITYGTAAAATLPQPEPGLAIPTDITLANSISCGTGVPATTFIPPPQNVTFPADGSYLLHYFAQDCAGTQELKFLQDANLSWSTSFYTVPVNVDTVAPAVASGPTLSPAPANGSYTLNQHVTATYRCTDDRSGIVTCGTSTFSHGTLNTGNLTSPVDTSTSGSKTFTVNAIDAAGNHTSSSVTYKVVASAPADLALLKRAAHAVHHNHLLRYKIDAANLSGGTASAVAVTDPLPTGVTFVSATAKLLSCTWSGCSATPEPCTLSNNTVTCSASSLPPISSSSFAVLGIEIVVRATAAKGAILINTATITSADPDPHPGNNHSTATTKVR